MDTVKIQHKDDHGNDHLIINRADFDSEKHKLYDEGEADPAAPLSAKEAEIAEDHEARRRFEANRGQTVGSMLAGDRNSSGTFSEPTPSDIRYPNKDETEFENNHGAFVGKSAAEMREAEGMADLPGGLNPQKYAAEQAKVADASLEAANVRDDRAKEVRRGRPAAPPTDDLDEMTAAQLREYAAAHDIDLGGATRKDDIRAAIDAAQDAA